ncbi:hypothetical protein GCM10010393_28250 [Streptomyces gobitricini]|uniref:Uncharacterized protein n=1 Tax=Streptomyces gobitricini TaxID=68211 RepID=A0ABP5ZAE7_9ACTN
MSPTGTAGRAPVLTVMLRAPRVRMPRPAPERRGAALPCTAPRAGGALLPLPKRFDCVAGMLAPQPRGRFSRCRPPVDETLDGDGVCCNGSEARGQKGVSRSGSTVGGQVRGIGTHAARFPMCYHPWPGPAVTEAARELPTGGLR